MRRKVSPGERGQLSASWFNDVVDALEYLARLRATGGQGVEFTRSQTTVKLRNDTGSDLGRFAPVQLGAPFITADDNEAEYQAKPNFKGVLPDGSTQNLAVLLTPLAEDAIDSAVVSGVVPVRVNRTSTSHEFAKLSAGNVIALRSDAYLGARILDPPPGTGSTGVQWCLVLLPYQCCCAPQSGSGSGSGGSGGGSSVQTGCCENAIASSLGAGIAWGNDCVPSCGSTGDPLTLAYDEPSGTWVGTGTACGGETLSLSLECTGADVNSWQLSVTCGSGSPKTATASGACDPLFLFFGFTLLASDFPDCCPGGGTLDVYIVE